VLWTIPEIGYGVIQGIIKYKSPKKKSNPVAAEKVKILEDPPQQVFHSELIKGGSPKSTRATLISYIYLFITALGAP
jgi:hypothetical protein